MAKTVGRSDKKQSGVSPGWLLALSLLVIPISVLSTVLSFIPFSFLVGWGIGIFVIVASSNQLKDMPKKAGLLKSSRVIAILSLAATVVVPIVIVILYMFSCKGSC